MLLLVPLGASGVGKWKGLVEVVITVDLSLSYSSKVYWG